MTSTETHTPLITHAGTTMEEESTVLEYGNEFKTIHPTARAWRALVMGHLTYSPLFCALAIILNRIFFPSSFDTLLFLGALDRGGFHFWL